MHNARHLAPHALPKTILLRQQWLQSLRVARLPDPQMELNALWRATTNDPLPLLASSKVTPSLALRLTRLVERRAQREPLARITNRREFASLTFRLNKACLIPRPDSETLLAAVLTLTTSPSPVRRIAELGCGCGCVVLALAAQLEDNPQRPLLKAFDASAQALVAARQNARDLKKTLPVRFSRQNWSDKKYLKKSHGGKQFDLLFANPPYIRRRERIMLSREVARFDPPLALDGGFDGMRDFRHILRYAQRTLCYGGFLVFEHAPRQARLLKTLAQRKGFRHLRTLPDLAGDERVSVLRKHPLKRQPVLRHLWQKALA